MKNVNLCEECAIELIKKEKICYDETGFFSKTLYFFELYQCPKCKNIEVVRSTSTISSGAEYEP